MPSWCEHGARTCSWGTMAFCAFPAVVHWWKGTKESCHQSRNRENDPSDGRCYRTVRDDSCCARTWTPTDRPSRVHRTGVVRPESGHHSTKLWRSVGHFLLCVILLVFAENCLPWNVMLQTMTLPVWLCGSESVFPSRGHCGRGDDWFALPSFDENQEEATVGLSHLFPWWRPTEEGHPLIFERPNRKNPLLGVPTDGCHPVMLANALWRATGGTRNLPLVEVNDV